MLIEGSDLKDIHAFARFHFLKSYLIRKSKISLKK